MIVYQIIARSTTNDKLPEISEGIFLYKFKAEKLLNELERHKEEKEKCFYCPYWRGHIYDTPIRTNCPYHKPYNMCCPGWSPEYSCENMAKETDLYDFEMKEIYIDESRE